MKMQSQSSNCAKMLAEVDESGAKDLSVDPSTFGFPQDANQEFSNRALQFGYSVSRQGFEDKGFLTSVPDFVLNSAPAALGEYQQFDQIFWPLQPVESDAMQVQNNDINIAHCSRPSNASCLDHVEEITSYDTDGYDDRAISFGSSCSTGIASYPYSSPLQSNNCIADMQDGTWTALMQMQEALEASNEECSDLTFNNAELSGGNTMQHQVVWDNGCLTSPSFTSNFLPFPGEAEATLTNANAVCSLQNFVDLQHDSEQDISSFELKVPEQKEPTTSHVCQHRDDMHSAEWGTNPGHEESSDLMPVTQDRQNNISHQQFSSSVNSVDGSVDSGMKKLDGLYECEEQMEIDSLLNSFGASSDTFSQTYEIFQKGENFVDLDKKVKLEESISATCISNTVPYTTQAGATESAVSDGPSCPQQYQSTSQSCGLFYSSASQWKTMSSSVFPLWGCQNGVNESNSLVSLGTNGKDHLLYSDHTSVQQQQSVSNPNQELTTGVDGQFGSKRAHLCHDGALATKGVWAAHPDMMENCFFGVCSPTHTGHSDMQFPMTQTTHVQLPAPNLSKDPDSSFIGGTELKKVDHYHSDMQLPITQTTHVQLPGPSFSKDTNSSFIGGTELKKANQYHSDMQLPIAQVTHVQLPAPSLSKDPNSSFIGGTELKKVDQLDDYSHVGSPHQSIILSTIQPSCSSGLPIDRFDGKVGSQPKKRKRSTANLLAWHAQVMSRCGRMHCRRTPELDWAHATKRLVEKVDGENATMENGSFVSRAQKRLVFTTSLIQNVLPVLPVRLLASNVTMASETIPYHISKLALGDTFGPVLSFVDDTNNFMQSENMPSNETGTSGKEDCNIVSEVLETFHMRFAELKSSLSRVEKTPTFQDLASEIRDIERWSILHHFVKLHIHNTSRAGDASNSRANSCMTNLQKHAGVAAAQVDALNSIRCRLLK